MSRYDNLLWSVRTDHRLTVVWFAEEVIAHADAVPADDRGRRFALDAVAQLETRGWTDLAAGWIAAAHRLDVAPDWRDRDTGVRSHGATMTALLTVVTDTEVLDELPDPEVGRVVARMWQKHLRLESTLLNTEGRMQEA